MNFETHLSEEQLDDVLMGDPGLEATTHLLECAACKERIAALEVSIASFAAVSLAWSERRSVTTPPPAMVAMGSAWPRRMSWALVSTCLLLIGFAIPMARHEEHENQTMVANEPREAAPSKGSAPEQLAVIQASGAQVRVAVVTTADHSADAQIARDNRMLRAIDRELDASMQSPSDAFGAMAVGGRPKGHGRNAPAPSWD